MQDIHMYTKQKWLGDKKSQKGNFLRDSCSGLIIISIILPILNLMKEGTQALHNFKSGCLKLYYDIAQWIEGVLSGNILEVTHPNVFYVSIGFVLLLVLNWFYKNLKKP